MSGRRSEHKIDFLKVQNDLCSQVLFDFYEEKCTKKLQKILKFTSYSSGGNSQPQISLQTIQANFFKRTLANSANC